MVACLSVCMPVCMSVCMSVLPEGARCECMLWLAVCFKILHNTYSRCMQFLRD